MWPNLLLHADFFIFTEEIFYGKLHLKVGTPLYVNLWFCWHKSVRIRSYSGPHFSAFGLNTERYSVSLHIQSKCGKMRTIKTPNTDLFYAVKANTVTYRKSFLFPKEMEFNLFSGLSLSSSLYIFAKMQNISRWVFHQKFGIRETNLWCPCSWC